MIFFSTDTKDKLNYYLLLLIAFIIPLKEEWLSPLIICFVLSSLWVGVRRGKEMQKGEVVFLVAFFYVIGILGVLYSDYTDALLFKAEVRLSLLAFPVGFYFSKLEFDKIVPNVLKAFVEGCLVAVVLNFIHSSLLFFEGEGVGAFFYDKSSYLFHISYFSYYLTFAIASLYFLFFHPSKRNYIKQLHLIAVIVLFSLAVVVGASKAGLLSLVAVHLSAFAYWIVRHKKYRQGLVAGAIFVVSVSIVVGVSKPVRERLYEVVQTVSSSEKLKPNSSTAMRLIAWKEAVALIEERPLLGYGMGDVSFVLVKRYKQHRYDSLVDRRLNTHNEFLQIAVGSGLVGLGYFLFLLVFPFFKLKKYFFIYAFFVLITVINFATESMLERQAGVVFFSFFITLFYRLIKRKGEVTNHGVSLEGE